MDRGQLDRFFVGLRSRIDLAREVDAQLDRELARRFNVLDYIRTSELGLSRVIGDLLDPKASHGQDILFLDILLRGLKRSSENVRRPLDLTRDYGDKWDVRPNSVRVHLERTIAGGRRLDVSVEFEGSDGRRRCLAIENKAGAPDQRGQVCAYLNFLDDEYGTASAEGTRRHCLIYLSPRGEPPSPTSVKRERLQDAAGGFAVWSYSRRVDKDIESKAENAGFRLDYSASDWLLACRKASDVDRLRSFLRDAESFCEQHFGGRIMADTETGQIVSFLQEPDNPDIAAAVHRHWPEARRDLLRVFAKRLARRISTEVGERFHLKCEHSVTGRDDKYQAISLFRDRGAWSLASETVQIRLEAQGPGLKEWLIGVCGGKGVIPDTALADTLGKGRSTSGWPWFRFVDDSWKSWDDIAPDLARETEADGDATRYFLNRFHQICEKAVPIIDDAVRRSRGKAES